MSQSTKWKLAIVAGISEYLVYAEAKYCAFEINREPKYYVCPRTEYCCNFGCCVSPGFQIYHLWYYWLLVIIMFLVCSGGGWWYRYWLQGRYRAAASAIPTRSSSSRTQNPLRGPTCQAQQARITYNTARNTVLLHRMWKGPHRSATSPAYSGVAGAASSAAHYQNTSVVLNDANCPYYQLYGPPPSYETVIAQTRGKISSPSSPELLQRPGLQLQPTRSLAVSGVPSVAEPGFVGQCFYSVPPALLSPPPPQPPPPPPGLEAPQYQATAMSTPTRIEGFDTAEYARLVQQYGNGPTPTPTTTASTALSPRHQQLYPHHHQQQQQQYAEAIVGRGAADYERSSLDNSDAENRATNCSQPNSSSDEGGFSITRIDCVGSSCALDRQLQCSATTGKLSSRVRVHGMSRRELPRFDRPSSSQSELTPAEPVATTSSSLGFENSSLAPTSHRSRSELRKIQGGSLKIPRRRDRQAKQQQQHQQQQQQQQYEQTYRISRRLSSADYCEPSSSQESPDPQSSPSSHNVIFAANATSKSGAVDGPDPVIPVLDGAADHDQRNDQQQQQQQQQNRHYYYHHHSQQQQRTPAATIADRSSTNSNLESKRKLDRSRSLD